jgi:hypothetical protein
VHREGLPHLTDINIVYIAFNNISEFYPVLNGKLDQ